MLTTPDICHLVTYAACTPHTYSQLTCYHDRHGLPLACSLTRPGCSGKTALATFVFLPWADTLCTRNENSEGIY